MVASSQSLKGVAGYAKNAPIGGTGYGHQAWSAGPINAFSLWEPTSVRITKGEANIGTHNKTNRASAGQ
jgi:hypothetical protein